MRLKINNVAELENIALKIDGLTIIAGENNTGKSTINKCLYAAFNSLNSLSEHVFTDKINSFLTDLKEELISNADGDDYRERYFISKIIDNGSFVEEIKRLSLAAEINDINNFIRTYLSKEIIKRKLTIPIDNLNKEVFNIEPYLRINNDEIKKKIATKMFQSEFNGTINNIHDDTSIAEIILEIKDYTTSYKIQLNHVTEITNNLSLELQAVYVDNLYPLDNVMNVSHKRLFEKGHRTALIDSFFNFYDNNITSEILKENRLKKIFSIINDIAKGYIIFDGISGIRYRESETDGAEKALSFSNISDGLKTFILLKELILNKTLKDNGTIIFDEPEIHLHPEWQIKLAELIVLIQKEYGMHIVLTTHSPYFLYALEVFSTKYGISEKTNYYYTQRKQGKITVENIGKNLEIIYSVLNKPFQTIEDLTSDLY
ncbi:MULTISPECIES: AAA family ATPase [Streptococcus]|uniref:AAA family ATPase n=1 Tax=Streptococcus TaxID=1301 RepID=UPI00352CECC2